MAISISNEDRTVMGDRVVIFATVTLDNSYPTGGEAIANTDFSGLKEFILKCKNSRLQTLLFALPDYEKSLDLVIIN